MKRTQKNRAGETGSVAVFVAVVLAVLFGLVALVVDTGHLMTTRNELQNAADAGALAGARSLFLSSLAGTEPDWNAGQAAALAAVRSNRSESFSLLDADVQVGYWNLDSKVLQPASITPAVNDVPAVVVKVQRAEDSNRGPVVMFFAPMIGINTVAVSAQAMATIGFVKKIDPGEGFPLAIYKDLVEENWYQDPAPSFRIGSTYHYPDSEAGQWTSFNVDANDVPTIRELMDNGNPESLEAGVDTIWIQPGTKTALYNTAANMIGQTVLCPVVQELSTHDRVPLLGFVAFQIDAVSGGSDKFIQGRFVENCLVARSSPGGPNYGAVTPPRLTR